MTHENIDVAILPPNVGAAIGAGRDHFVSANSITDFQFRKNAGVALQPAWKQAMRPW
jgi:hypothetical protein